MNLEWVKTVHIIWFHGTLVGEAQSNQKAGMLGENVARKHILDIKIHWQHTE